MSPSRVWLPWLLFIHTTLLIALFNTLVTIANKHYSLFNNLSNTRTRLFLSLYKCNCWPQGISIYTSMAADKTTRLSSPHPALVVNMYNFTPNSFYIIVVSNES